MHTIDLWRAAAGNKEGAHVKEVPLISVCSRPTSHQLASAFERTDGQCQEECKPLVLALEDRRQPGLAVSFLQNFEIQSENWSLDAVLVLEFALIHAECYPLHASPHLHILVHIVLKGQRGRKARLL
jgi:hypothetical protein